MFVIKYRTFCWWLLSDEGSESGSQGGKCAEACIPTVIHLLFLFAVCASWFGVPECPIRKELYSYGVGLWTCSWYLRKWSIRDYIRGMTVFHFFFNFYFFYKWMQNLGITEWQAQSRRCRILRGLFSWAQMSLVVLQLACKEGVFCNASDNAIRRTNFLPQSWTLKLTESWRE